MSRKRRRVGENGGRHTARLDLLIVYYLLLPSSPFGTLCFVSLCFRSERCILNEAPKLFHRFHFFLSFFLCRIVQREGCVWKTVWGICVEARKGAIKCGITRLVGLVHGLMFDGIAKLIKQDWILAVMGESIGKRIGFPGDLLINWCLKYILTKYIQRYDTNGIIKRGLFSTVSSARFLPSINRREEIPPSYLRKLFQSLPTTLKNFSSKAWTSKILCTISRTNRKNSGFLFFLEPELGSGPI